ncbi:uncharacterized protein LOC142616076 [Castanea sativa]|uniref:uncharacterized protein LOC142616076 n=1 Tax=Castanea sativa TaxID=21020 RepID=UPI003F64AB18
MSLLCWNCRGLRNPQKIQELGDLIRAQDPAVVFIAKAWLTEARLKNFLKKLNFGDMHVVSKINQGGGLVLLWKTDLLLRVDSSSLNHIDAIIDEGRENSWWFTGFYGAPETHNCHVSLFPASKVYHLECGCSDHKLIIVHPLGIPIWHQKPWRFEQVWLQEEGCHEAVNLAWTSTHSDPSPMVRVTENLQSCQVSLKLWSKNSFGNITRQLVEVRKKLKEAEMVAVRGGSMNRFLSLKGELRCLLTQEEKLWQQRAKSAWLKGGDQNSNYFHSRASQRYRRNEIKRLRREDGSWCEGEDQLAGMFVDYFQHLFCSSNLASEQMEVVLANIPQLVSSEMNQSLLSEFTKAEVDLALIRCLLYRHLAQMGCRQFSTSTIGKELEVMCPKQSSLALIQSPRKREENVEEEREKKHDDSQGLSR